MEEVLARVRGADSPIHRPARAGAPLRRGRARHAAGASHASTARPVKLTSHEFRVAVVPDAPPRPRGLAGRAHRAHLRAGVRPRFEHRRGVRRAACAASSAPAFIETVRGLGYRVSGIGRHERAAVAAGAAAARRGALDAWACSGWRCVPLHACRCWASRIRRPSVHTLLSHTAIALASASRCCLPALRRCAAAWSSINQLRTRLGGLRDGRERRLEGVYPAEVAAACRRSESRCSTSARK